MSRRPVQLALVTSVVAVAFFAACPEPPPPPPDSLSLIANPLSIPSNGTTTTITVTARTGQNQPGTGNVSLSAGAGTFGAGRTTTVTLGANGTGTAAFSCNVSSDPACSAGSVRIDGSWSGPSGQPTTNYTNVTLTGGGGGGDAGNSIGLAAGKNPLTTNVGDTSVLTATVMSLPDGGGFPVAGATISFSTSLGALGPNDGGASSGTTFSETTNASGQAFSVLHAGNTAGTATVTATGGAAGTRAATATVQLNDPSLGASASKNPINTHVGDSSVVTATLRSLPDGGGSPVPGVAISFSTSLGTLGPNDGGAPGGTTFSGTTNASGQASAVLYAGITAGNATVSTAGAGRTASTAVQLIYPGVGLSASRSPILTYVGDTSVLTATVRSLPDGGGIALQGMTLNFSTNLGTLGPNDGGPAGGTTFSEATNASGQAFAVLYAGTTAGTAAVSAAGAGGAPSAGTSVQFVNPSLGLSASRSPIYTNVGDFSVLTSTMRSSPDGGFAISGAPVTFTTTLGTLGPNDGGASTGTSYTESTNAAGQAFARLHAGAVPGAAALSATGYGASAGATVQISDLSQITFVSSACGTQSPCTLMGVRGSGRNETATLTFQVTAIGGGAASNVPVTFSLGSGAPLGATVSPGGVTDATGRVQAIVQSGSGIGVLSVNALVYPPIQTSSPGIGITGARVSNAGISILCEAVNVPAYISPTPPRDITVNCSVRLTDRYTNAIGFPTTVNFVAEAGTVSTSVVTAPFNFNNPSDPNIGRASFTFSTRAGTGRALPVDVTPLASAPGQDPAPRLPEPSYPAGSLTLNPRDGLLTIVAYVNGEEYFNDSNGNGTYNLGEQFYDQGERLVDADDDGIWVLGESFFDENNNGLWDGPDGVYQSDKQVWTEYRLLYTDLPFNGLLVPNPFSGPCLPPDAGTPAPDAGLPLAKGTFVNLDIFASDRHLNIPSAGTAFTITHTANKGSVRLNGGTTLLDSYGFGIDRVLVNAPDGGSPSQLLCRPVDPVCYFKVQFYNWSGGQIGTTATVTGAPITDSQPCQPDTVTVTATELTIPTGFISTGAIE